MAFRSWRAADLDVVVGTAHPQLAGCGVDGRAAVPVLQGGVTVDEADAQAERDPPQRGVAIPAAASRRHRRQVKHVPIAVRHAEGRT
ncbi:hypothetical protein ABZ446_45720 [Streptomyces sp. NPDC005813]|uniref:hypothetical protein n=1 Tax=Streptomyces sp. NPDC005813 TaxID=3155592 RepID=UPI003400A3BF